LVGARRFFTEAVFLFSSLGMMLYRFLPRFGKQVTYWQGFVRLGEVSYATYLVHWPILVARKAHLAAFRAERPGK
jgi:peptidoglycan/LPS O-acetylase OafA/YrhL